MFLVQRFNCVYIIIYMLSTIVCHTDRELDNQQHGMLLRSTHQVLQLYWVSWRLCGFQAYWLSVITHSVDDDYAYCMHLAIILCDRNYWEGAHALRADLSKLSIATLKLASTPPLPHTHTHTCERVWGNHAHPACLCLRISWDQSDYRTLQVDNSNCPQTASYILLIG